MEADANQWLAKNKERLNNGVRKWNPRITGGYPKRREKKFARIARMAGWADHDRNSIGIEDGCWATRRYPVLIAANKREAIAVCDGLNHRHRKHRNPDATRFGWLPASAFPPAEQLEIAASIREAQTGRLRAEPRPTPSLAALSGARIHSLAAQAMEFHAACKVTQPKNENGSGQADRETDNSKKILPDNPDVTDLCKLLSRDLPKRKSQIEIALEFTRDNREKAENLLRQARRFRHLWPQPDKLTRTGQ
jgi:hypothetical protein